jgi:hypothetical protein
VDLKRGLSAVTDEEWENIPEVGNLTRKKRKRDFERSWVVPDSVLVGNRASTEYENSLDGRQQQQVCARSPLLVFGFQESDGELAGWIRNTC